MYPYYYCSQCKLKALIFTSGLTLFMFVSSVAETELIFKKIKQMNKLNSPPPLHMIIANIPYA